MSGIVIAGTPLSMSELGEGRIWQIAGSDGAAFSAESVRGMSHQIADHPGGAMERAVAAQPTAPAAVAQADLNLTQQATVKPLTPA